MSDLFENHASTLMSPAASVFAITANDAVDLQQQTRAIYVGQGGNVTLTTASGQTATFVNVADGSILPLRVQRIYQTGTTATGLVGLY